MYLACNKTCSKISWNGVDTWRKVHGRRTTHNWTQLHSNFIILEIVVMKIWQQLNGGLKNLTSDARTTCSISWWKCMAQLSQFIDGSPKMNRWSSSERNSMHALMKNWWANTITNCLKLTRAKETPSKILVYKPKKKLSNRSTTEPYKTSDGWIYPMHRA